MTEEKSIMTTFFFPSDQKKWCRNVITNYGSSSNGGVYIEQYRLSWTYTDTAPTSLLDSITVLHGVHPIGASIPCFLIAGRKGTHITVRAHNSNNKQVSRGSRHEQWVPLSAAFLTSIICQEERKHLVRVGEEEGVSESFPNHHHHHQPPQSTHSSTTPHFCRVKWVAYWVEGNH